MKHFRVLGPRKWSPAGLGLGQLESKRVNVALDDGQARLHASMRVTVLPYLSRCHSKSSGTAWSLVMSPPEIARIVI